LLFSEYPISIHAGIIYVNSTLAERRGQKATGLAAKTKKTTFTDDSTANISLEIAYDGEFFGIYHNDMPLIKSIALDATGDGAWGIDTIEYGSPVPIPEALWLLGSGLLGLIGLRRRRRR
jgi:hypothetical protein